MSEQLKITPVVYVPVSYEDAESLAVTSNLNEDKDELRLFIENTHLKELKSMYVLTPEELLELKRKWAGEDFIAGVKWANETSNGTPTYTENPNQFTYINNLTIE